MEDKDISYAEAISEIEKILGRFENEQFDIDELAENVRKATELISLCTAKLRKAEEEVAAVFKEDRDTQ